MDDYEVILKRKIDYYGETPAAHQLAAEEYGRQQYEKGFNEGKEVAYGLIDPEP